MKKIISALMVLTFIFVTNAFAQTSYPFTCNDSFINASIKYSVIGRYQAGFKDCSGEIIFDDQKDQVKAVKLEIKIKSLKSNCDWCDKIVLSKRLMNAEKYPLITFESESIGTKNGSHEVSGILRVHGVDGKLKSPFSIEEFTDSKDGKHHILLRGVWVINRKNYGIIWNKALDRKGVVVGDWVDINWEVVIDK